MHTNNSGATHWSLRFVVTIETLLPPNSVATLISQPAMWKLQKANKRLQSDGARDNA